MARPVLTAIAALVLLANSADAGPVLNWLGHHNDPPPSYPPIRYWAPNVARIGDCLHKPHLSVYPPDRHPEVPPTFALIKFRCATAAPGDTLIEVPAAPESSKAK